MIYVSVFIRFPVAPPFFPLLFGKGRRDEAA